MGKAAAKKFKEEGARLKDGPGRTFLEPSPVHSSSRDVSMIRPSVT
jgi:hypothetical protein